MSSITEAIAKYNTQGGQDILKKYNQRPALDVRDMIVKLDKIGNQWTDSHVDFAGAHPDKDFFSTYLNCSGGCSNCSKGNGEGHHNCSGCSMNAAGDAEAAAPAPKGSFLSKNQNVLIVAVALVLAAAILKK